MPPTVVMDCNPGMSPGWELNWRPFGLQAGVQSTEPHQPRLFFKYTLLIMLLQLSQFFLFSPLHLVPLFHLAIPHLSACPWVVYVCSLAFPLPILFLTPPCLFCTYTIVFLNPYTFFSILPLLPPSWYPSKWSPYLWFYFSSNCLLSFFFVCLFVCLIRLWIGVSLLF